MRQIGAICSLLVETALDLYAESLTHITHQSDVIIYGGTSAAVNAGVEVARSGKKAIIVSPDIHLGGLSSGGLGFTDPIDLAKILKKHFTVHHAYIINNMIIRAMNILDLPINSPNEESCRRKTKN
ncbi:FAD-dependent oxidoreductase [Tannerella sp.]|uniref:FAD-dependent oxidoreductase n=1 Tax=Tannerella sp. TaxID=2382127 RepID=UPI0034A5048B